MVAKRKLSKSAALSAPPKAVVSATRVASEGVDKLIHEPVRLGVLCALAGVERMSFVELKQLLSTTDGNLSVHLRRLEEAAYLTCAKGFRGRTPHTTYQLTDAGRAALEAYVNHMEALVRHANRVFRAR
ncbi:MAG: transcriptional regulator [Chloracidobacterium sp. CP2_5A]|nr:MAG: transcriptional regulator [Chloracidobacterium sp. CP2_5A]